jgi:hypothetical protein
MGSTSCSPTFPYVAEDQYFVIHGGGDGPTVVYQCTWEQLQKALKKGEFNPPAKALSSAPVPTNSLDWYGNYLIIKGRVVKPVREWRVV